MAEMLEKLYTRVHVKLPPDVAVDFTRHCAQKNNARFSVLPIFNIITQVVCYFIYLHIYPATFPDRQRLDPTLFMVLSAVYVLINVFFFISFNRLRGRSGAENFVRASNRTLVAFLLFYVVFESIETCMEVEISGNIYRFLATFFMVAFLPVMPQLGKFLTQLLFMVGVETGLFYLVSRGYVDDNRFRAIIFLFFLVCVVVSLLTYNSAVRTFMLQHNLMAVNAELRTANERLEHLAVVDPLTQIANRRAFDQYMALTWRNAYQNGRHLTAVMVDIDDFKAYNDTYGHQKGDDCLVAVAACIQGFFYRKTDMVARYGGEEFIVLLAQDDVENIPALLEKMRRGVEELAIENKNGSTGGLVTISVGYATALPAKDVCFEDLIKQADDALYMAKRKGKNRVCALPGNAGAAVAVPVAAGAG